MGFFGGGGASVDLASPPAIGNTTPNTGAFTTLSATPPANTTAFSSSGYSLTGTNAQSFFDLAGTWNTSGTPTGILLNITNTASNSSSKLIDLKINGNTKFAVQALDGGAGGVFTITQYGFTLGGRTDFADAIALTSTGEYRIGSDTALARDAANVFAQRRTTNAQTFRLYNTFTDASNYERGFFRWNTNVLEIGAEAAGTGTKRNLRVVGPSLASAEAVPALEVTQTWNTTGTPSAILLNVTNTASNSASRLIDLKIGGTTKFAVEALSGTALILEQYGIKLEGARFFQDALQLVNTGEFRISTDTLLSRDAADTFAQRRTTNAQTFRLYRTFTDASNYERLSLIATRTTRFAIAAENAGTGAARSLEISFYTSASDPTSTDITSGCFSVWKNSGTGTIKLWANDGGTMKSVALA